MKSRSILARFAPSLLTALAGLTVAQNVLPVRLAYAAAPTSAQRTEAGRHFKRGLELFEEDNTAVVR